jgi:hypothetical protein
MITFVTAFLCGSNPKRSIEVYRELFLRLAETGIPIVLFLDANTGWTSFPPNVRVVPASLADTWVGHNVPLDAQLPNMRSPPDTREYMMIQSAKSEFVVRATQVNPFHTEWFAWIDCGIGHVFRTPETTLEQLKTMAPPQTPCMRTAGIWRHTPESLFDAVCWRFAGGFFLVHATLADSFHEEVIKSIQRNLPRFAWEVNTWADVERNGMDLGWYPSDHGDSIVSATSSTTASAPQT